MKAPQRFLSGLLAGALAFLLGTGVALGCDCEATTTAEHVAAADVVARVVVERVSMPESGASQEQMATYSMRPSYVWKGDVVSRFTLSSERAGTGCGLEGINKGDDVVVFATQSSDGLRADLCSGTAKASDGLVTELLNVAGHGQAVDALPGDEPGAWVVPTVAALIGVGLVGSVLMNFWVLPRRRL